MYPLRIRFIFFPVRILEFHRYGRTPSTARSFYVLFYYNHNQPVLTFTRDVVLNIINVHKKKKKINYTVRIYTTFFLQSNYRKRIHTHTALCSSNPLHTNHYNQRFQSLERRAISNYYR